MEEVGEKEKKVREGVVKREMKEVEVADSDVAPVIGFFLSVARRRVQRSRHEV